MTNEDFDRLDSIIDKFEDLQYLLSGFNQTLEHLVINMNNPDTVCLRDINSLHYLQNAGLKHLNQYDECFSELHSLKCQLQKTLNSGKETL